MMKDELSLLINRTLKDPRIPFVTVTDVQITRDVKQATVYFSVMAGGQASDPEVAASCQLALENARGYLRKQLSVLMQLRFVPSLIFREDKGLENTMRVSELLKQINDEKKPDSIPGMEKLTEQLSEKLSAKTAEIKLSKE